MLAEVANDKNDQVYRNSLLRLLRQSNDSRKWDVIEQSVNDPSPLVRASTVSALGQRSGEEGFELLLVAAGDKSRLVRIRAAMALAAISPDKVQDEKQREILEKAVEEFKTAMKARTDDWAAYANLGNSVSCAMRFLGSDKAI